MIDTTTRPAETPQQTLSVSTRDRLWRTLTRGVRKTNRLHLSANRVGDAVRTAVSGHQAAGTGHIEQDSNVFRNGVLTERLAANSSGTVDETLSKGDESNRPERLFCWSSYSIWSSATEPTQPMDTTLIRTRIRSYRSQFETIDELIATQMDRWSVPVLRVAIAVVFIWFGALKVFGISPASELVASTVYLVDPALFVPVLGGWEVLIGLCLLYRPLIRVGIFLLFLQLPGTFLPIILLPEVVFTSIPYGLTVEGQYIIKNLVIIGAALVIGGTVRENTGPSQE